METEPLIVTILIQMHGKVINVSLDNEKKELFRNVKLLCKAEGFNDYESRLGKEIRLSGKITNKYRREVEKNADETLREAQKGKLVDNIKYDKLLTAYLDDNSNMFNLSETIAQRYQGIYLLSIHRGNQLVFPEKDDYRQFNLLNIETLNQLAKRFNGRLPILDNFNDELPNQGDYIKLINDISNNPNYTDEQKELEIEGLKNSYINAINNWTLKLNSHGNIQMLKLSTLVDILKGLISEDFFINIIDYSCNSITTFMPKNIPLPTSLGGRKIKIKTTRTKPKRRNKRKTKRHK
jgi:hypothetical protein